MHRRILLLITDLQIGGTPTVVRELARRLHRPPEVEAEVACLAGPGPIADELRAMGIAVTELGASGPYDVGVIGRLVQLIGRRGYDTVFSFLIHANAAAAVASLWRRDVRFIQSIQTTQPYPGWHWHLQRIVRHAAERIVVPSPSVARMAQDLADVSPEQIEIIPNALDPDEFTPSLVPMADPRPYPVVFLGRLDPIKDIPNLVQAIALVAGESSPRQSLAHLHIYGEGTARGEIEAEVNRLILSSIVTFHGAVTRPQEALSQAGMLVLPSRAEGFGLVLIEAMAAGVPVVATDVPGIRDVVRHGVTGLLVEPGEPAALANAIRRIIEDAPLRQRLIAGGSQEVRRRFTWDQVMGQYQRLLGL